MSKEFVMVPREQLKHAADRLSDMGQTSLSEPLFGLMNEQHQGEPVALPERKGTHLRYDTLMPTFSKGWNACLDEIAKLGPLYTRPAQGEPVAWLNTATGAVTVHPVQVMDWDDESEPVKSLYTHADPGEVERLRSELSTITKLYGEACQASYDFGNLRAQLNSALDLSGERFDEVQKLRAQLAERDALLREFCERVERGEVRSKSTYAKFKAALSASAEPSAPVEIDHLTPDEINQMAFEEGQPAENGDGYVFTQEEFDLFVTRLLDRHGTPVEIDERAAVPANCRQRLLAEGKAYPRSSCAICGAFSPKWKECDAALGRKS